MKDQFKKTVAVELQLHESVLGWSGSAYINQYTHCLFKGFCIGWQYRQTEVDELKASHHGEMIGHEHHISKIKKQNAWLSDVAERENKRANNLQQDKTSTTILLGKTIQEKNDLRKRLDAALKRSKHALQYVEEDKRGGFEFLQMAMIRVFKDLEQALTGGES